MARMMALLPEPFGPVRTVIGATVMSPVSLKALKFLSRIFVSMGLFYTMPASSSGRRIRQATPTPPFLDPPSCHPLHWNCPVVSVAKWQGA